MDQESRGVPRPPHDQAPNAGTPQQVPTFAPLPGPQVPPAPEKPRGSGSRRLGTRIAALALIVLGLFGAGTAAGWWGHRQWQATRAEEVLEPDTDTRPFLEAASAAMPDVRGLAEPVARQILTDAGLTGDRVRVDSRPFAGIAGIVVEQDPPFGAADPASVTLTVSVPAAVPAIEGRDETAVVTELRELGTQVSIARRYQPGVAAGTVLQIDPPSGSPLPETATVTVSADPATAYLSDVEAAENGCSTGEYTLAGREEAHALSCSVADADARSPRGPMWEFNRAVEDIRLTVGLPSDAEPGAKVKMIATVDGRVVQESVVEFGATVALSVSTRDAVQFSLLFVADAGEPDRVTVAGEVQGSREAIIALTESR